MTRIAARTVHRITTRGKQATVVLALLVAVAACGSTVPLTSSSGVSDGGLGLGQSSQQPATTSAGGVGGTTGNALSTAGGASPATNATGSSTPGPGAATASGSPVIPGTVGGTTNRPIEVGFIATSCANCALLSSSYVAPSYSDQQVAQAVIDGVNAQGGIQGRKLHAIYAPIDTTRQYTPQYQAACARFTQDNHVVAVLGYGPIYSAILGECLSKAGVLWINGAFDVGDLVEFQKHPLYFATTLASMDAAYHSGLESALADNWISPASKLGILRGGCVYETRSFTNTVQPFLREHNLKLVSDQLWSTCYDGAPDLADATSFIQSSVLKMRSAGVDTVITTGIQLLLFSQNAQSQGWHPHYVAYGGGGGVYEGLVNSEQIRNIHAAGWVPTLDLSAAHQLPLTSTQRECLSTMRRGGMDVAKSGYNVAFMQCESVRLFAEGVVITKGDTVGAHVAQALESFGGRHLSALSLTSATSLGRRRHAAASVYRSNTYQSHCSCFLYVGPMRVLGPPW